jgi:hypothetical protein
MVGSASLLMFLFTLTATAGLLQLFLGSRIATTMGLYVGFLMVSGIIFVVLVNMVSKKSLYEELLWIHICGAYVLAWLAGLLTPGAPAGLGVRELVLFFLLKGFVPESDMVLSVLLGRVVTVAGDLVFFVLASINYHCLKASIVNIIR